MKESFLEKDLSFRSSLLAFGTQTSIGYFFQFTAFLAIIRLDIS